MPKKYGITDLLDAAVMSHLQDVHTCIPAIVLKYDEVLQEAVVQPIIKYRDNTAGSDNRGLIEMPPIVGVRVIFPASDNSIITFPIKEKSTLVWVMFSERSIDKVMGSGNKSPVDPEDIRMFDYSDAVAIVGFSLDKDVLGSHPEDLEIRMNAKLPNESKIAMKPNGDIVVTSSAKVEVLAASDINISTEANCNVTISGNASVNVSGSTTLTSPTVEVNGNTTFNGNVSINGAATVSQTLTASVDVIGGGKSLKTHIHTGVTSGGGVTGLPQ
jgi:hypothetical protein